MVNEITLLETQGIEIQTENGPLQVYVRLAQFTCDDLGMNQIIGFMGRFYCDPFCLFCYATRDDMRKNF
jgi:hypothetical protein